MFALNQIIGTICTQVGDENLGQLLNNMFKIRTPVNLKQFKTGLCTATLSSIQK